MSHRTNGFSSTPVAEFRDGSGQVSVSRLPNGDNAVALKTPAGWTVTIIGADRGLIAHESGDNKNQAWERARVIRGLAPG